MTLATSTATQAIRKTGTNTFANVDLSTGGGTWGSITGTLSAQTDLQIALDAKADDLAGTINEIAYFNSASTIASLSVATYPSLTELSYVKGVTSAIQTQLGNKQGTLTNSAGLLAALNDETGTGLAVFNTSPTLVTPLLGTPTSGVLTNCTGLPAASVVAGTFGTGAYVMDTTLTVPLVIGGTATTSDLSFKTTTATGIAGADMHFLVGSNGGTEAITILNSGYVGINQVAPAGMLDIGAGNIILDNNYAIQARSTTGNVQSILYKDTGNTVNLRNGNGNITINPTATEVMKFSSTGIVVNDNAADIDFRMEGTSAANLFYLDFGLAMVSINDTPAAGDYKFNVISSTASDGIQVENTSAGAAGAVLNIFHNSASPAVNDVASTILFSAKNNIGTTRNYGSIATTLSNVTGPNEVGRMDFSIYNSSVALVKLMGMDDTGIIINDSSYNWVDVRMEGDTMANLFFLDASADKIGINQTTPATLLDIVGVNDTTIVTINFPVVQASVTAADTYMNFTSTTGSEASIAGTAVAGVIAYNTFTGSHFTKVIDREGLEPNMLLEIVEGKVPEFPEQIIEQEIIDKETGERKTEMVRYKASPKEQIFLTKISETRKSKRAVGVYGGTNNEGQDLVLSIGTGFIYVANKGEDIEIGDYLIASDVQGMAEKQDDDLYHNYTVGKATENVIWKDEKSKLIKCIYLGG